MPIYISRGRFTSDAVKGMLAKPENREEAGGNLSDVETTVAMTAKDAAATLESAGKAAREFRSAGRP